MRRVVVTGLGMVSPLACGAEETWKRLLDCQSGAGTISRFDASGMATTYACEVPRGDGSDGTFNPDDWVTAKDQKKMDDFIVYGMAASDMAIADSGWQAEDEEAQNRAGVLIGSGIGGLTTIYQTSLLLKERGPRRVSPFFIPASLGNLASGQVSIKHGLRGPNHSVVTACATGAHAIGDAARLIMLDDADVMIAGGAEASINELGIAGFNACKALSTKRGDAPETASRPEFSSVTSNRREAAFCTLPSSALVPSGVCGSGQVTLSSPEPPEIRTTATLPSGTVKALLAAFCSDVRNSGARPV